MPKEPTGPYPELARLAREMVGGLTLRQAANRTGGKVSHDTITRLFDGVKIGDDKLDTLSLAFGWNPNRLRQAGGYGLLPGYPDPDVLAASVGTDDGLLEYIADSEVAEIVRYYRGIPPEMRPAARETLRGMKTAGDIVRQMAEENTIGKRADRDDAA